MRKASVKSVYKKESGKDLRNSLSKFDFRWKAGETMKPEVLRNIFLVTFVASTALLVSLSNGRTFLSFFLSDPSDLGTQMIYLIYVK